ncbi:MAG: helicase C-terminal domain-containing protein [Gemmatimonadota bacterium]|nr:helicase C-terminal domain-containing protein [Gemmatimonadota bacterium]
MSERADTFLVGLDGLEDPEPDAAQEKASPPSKRLTLSAEAIARIRDEIERAGGREVCFLATVDEHRAVHDPRAVSRGNHEAVLVAARDAPEGGLMVHNHPSGVLEPSEADMRVAGRLYEEGLGTAIVDNRAEGLYVVVEPPTPRVVRPLSVEKVQETLGPHGPLAEGMGGYEDRPGQRSMAALVTESYNDGGVTLVEAGTGTGKSLAYLVPAAKWALQNGERTILSTNTINLQEQLVGKDLPLVEKLVGDVSWALVKGRGNYVSIRRALLAADGQESLFEDDRSSEMKALLEWMETSDDGSLSDLDFVPSDDVWEEVRSDPDMCLRARCPHFQECFYQRSRRRAASAQLLVVNHHLLFTDLAVRRATGNYTQAAVLPSYKRVVLDEAHNVEDSATSHLGVELTRRGMYRTLSRLDRRGRGILTAVHEALTGGTDGGELRERLENRVRPSVATARSALEGLLERLEGLVTDDAGVVRLGPRGIGEPAEDAEVDEPLRAALRALTTLQREVAELRARLELRDDLSERLEGRLLDLRSVERRIAAAVHGLRLILVPNDDSARYVRWLESRGRGRRRNLALAAAPVELGALLRESLFTRAETTVLTSASLTTRGTFDFMKARLGLEVRPTSDEANEVGTVRERMIASPFDFERHTLLVVPTGQGAPDEHGNAWNERTPDDPTALRVGELAAITDGGLFVLFTSHAALRRTSDALRRGGIEARWPLFVQGEGQRHDLVDRFVAAGRGILLGTNSFWEGVDVPGEPLRGLVIHKLPFRVPTEPITAARMEAVEAAGGDSFRDFMLPHAALRLKQGFGRLVRGHEDKGVVIVLDDRLVTRRYGGYLRSSLPPAPLVKGAWHDVERRIGAFYGTSLGRGRVAP